MQVLLARECDQSVDIYRYLGSLANDVVGNDDADNSLLVFAESMSWCDHARVCHVQLWRCALGAEYIGSSHWPAIT